MKTSNVVWLFSAFGNDFVTSLGDALGLSSKYQTLSAFRANLPGMYLSQESTAELRILWLHRSWHERPMDLSDERLIFASSPAEASAVQAHIKQGLPLAPGMEISYVVKDAKKWKVDQHPSVRWGLLQTAAGGL